MYPQTSHKRWISMQLGRCLVQIFFLVSMCLHFWSHFQQMLQRSSEKFIKWARNIKRWLGDYKIFWEKQSTAYQQYRNINYMQQISAAWGMQEAMVVCWMSVGSLVCSTGSHTGTQMNLYHPLCKICAQIFHPQYDHCFA